MNFVQLEFPAFLAVVGTVYWLTPERRSQNLWLLGSSLVFYGWVHAWFVVLLLGASVVDFALTGAMATWPRRKNLFLALSLTTNLGLLGFFKYVDFGLDTVESALRAMGWTGELGTLGVILPVGISFYTFQTIGYAIDVWRGELAPRRDLVDYLTYVAFFPQLVAGPIERAGRLLPQVERARVWSWTRLRSGLGLMAWGAFKKVVIADSIAPFVDKVFVLREPAGPLIWAAAAGFLIQIFADFSGYTDIARGVARTLGFELCDNFDEPFLSRTTPEFWQRWHMSLSSWIRDYLMAPLVGSGVPTRARFVAATLVTFLVIGFWHGASWNYLLFGLYHGLWVVAYGLVPRTFPNLPKVPDALQIAFHTLVVGVVGGLIFREHDLGRLVHHFSTVPWRATGAEWIATVVLLSVVAAGCVPLLAGWAVRRFVQPRLATSPWSLPLETTGWALAVVALFVFHRITAVDFVYFQF